MSLHERPRLILHVGIPKTGTTSLQHSLASNATRLLSMGGGVNYCLFKPYEESVNHKSLVNAITHEFFSMNDDDTITSRGFSEFALMPVKNKVDFIKKSFYESNCKTLVLSHEGFITGFDFISECTDHFDENTRARYKEYVISYVKNFFDEFDIKVVIYLRRQDNYIESMYNQIMKRRPVKDINLTFKNGYLINSAMQAFLTRNDMITFCDYYSHLYQLSNVYGKENVIVRVYEKNQMPNGTVYDFYKHVLCFDDNEIDVLLAENHTVNESKIKDLVEYNIALAQDASRDMAHKEISSGRLNKLPSILGKLPSLDFLCKSNKNILTAKQASDFLDLFEESNEKVAREYLGREDGVLFRDKPRDEADDYKGLSHQATFHISKELILFYKESYERLKENNERLHKKLLDTNAEQASEKRVHLNANILLDPTKVKQNPQCNQLSELKTKNHELENEIKNLQNSTSWKITKPLRIMKKFFHK